LTDELTLPRELDADLRYAETYGKYCLLLTIVGMILFAAYYSGVILDLTLSALLLVAGLIVGMLMLVFIMLDVQWLSISRKVLVSMRDKINERETARLLRQSAAQMSALVPHAQNHEQ
jgi:hypothetical protein